MKPGTKVRVTGTRCFTGTVLAMGEDEMTIEEAPGCTVTLRRNPASTTPWQWRCAGMPVEIYSADLFRKRLVDLERKTR
jgi:hypothetical protein